MKEKEQGEDDVREQACQWALTRKRTLLGGGALELLDLRLFEDGRERGSALGSDVVARNTASKGQDGNGERVGVSMGADRKANALRAGAGAHLSEVTALPLSPAHSLVMPSAV